jgi:GNAT superfamily N-acetyltransferase
VIIASMANALNAHEGKSPSVYTPEVILRDAFGPSPAFGTLLADADGEVVGYATWLPGYNSDLGVRSMFLSDLFVVERARGRGIGRALLAAVAAETVRRGLACLEWGVMSANASAREFYRRIGAREGDVRILALDGAALTTLAREGQTYRTA